MGDPWGSAQDSGHSSASSGMEILLADSANEKRGTTASKRPSTASLQLGL